MVSRERERKKMSHPENTMKQIIKDLQDRNKKQDEMLYQCLSQLNYICGSLYVRSIFTHEECEKLNAKSLALLKQLEKERNKK